MSAKNKIIVAPLNWGLGHASRCIPIIHALLQNNFQPILASDGRSLEFLRKEFPDLQNIELPSYKISYRKNLKWNLMKRMPIIRKAVKKEHQLINTFISNNKDVVGIISDNRFGVYSKELPSVYITHQLYVPAGILTPLTTLVHQQIIKKFDECWIPDEPGSKFSGRLSRTTSQLNQKFIGVLSRFQKEQLDKTIDILIVLSGPEPNRTELERKITTKFYGTELNVCMVQGKVENQQTITAHGKFTVINFALTSELESLLNSAKYVICRSGYSSIMDLVTLGKRALLIPTRNQSEQEYLANYLKEKGLFDIVKEKNLQQEKIYLESDVSAHYFKMQELDSNLFRLFQSK